MSRVGKHLLAAGEAVVVFCVPCVAVAVVAAAAWAHRSGAPWWALGLVLAAPVCAGARVARDGQRLGLTYLGWRKGLVDGWTAESDAKRLTESIASEASDGREARGRGAFREGLERVLSGMGRAGRRSAGLSRADTEDSEDTRGRFEGRPETERFWENVDQTDGCWLWTGQLTDDGYGVFWVLRGGRWVKVRAHRWAWEQVNGPVPGGLTLDHVRARGCDHKHCVWVEHLEAVTPAENNRRAVAWRASSREDTEDVSEDIDLEGAT